MYHVYAREKMTSGARWIGKTESAEKAQQIATELCDMGNSEVWVETNGSTVFAYVFNPVSRAHDRHTTELNSSIYG